MNFFFLKGLRGSICVFVNRRRLLLVILVRKVEIVSGKKIIIKFI